MKKLMTGILLSLSLLPAIANAQWSANIGYTSEYIFRGITQKTSSASAGFDYSHDNGFYAGTWGADVGDGMEIDGYFGFGFSATEDLSLSIGFTGYYYTGDFDDTYQEINLGAGLGIFSLDVAIGEYENFTGPTQDYTFVSLSASADNGWYGVLGSFSQDAMGEYLEIGYGTELEEWSVTASVVIANSDLVGPGGDETLVLSIGRGFDL